MKQKQIKRKLVLVTLVFLGVGGILFKSIFTTSMQIYEKQKEKKNFTTKLEKLKDKDRLRKLLKHGTLAFHIVGLSEAIYREAVCLLRRGIGLLCSRSCHYLYGRRRYFPDQKNDREYSCQYSGNHLRWSQDLLCSQDRSQS